MKDTNDFEVIIIGGSYAGLSAAMALGRSLRKVLIIDSGKPCNEQTPHSHNFITQDGKTPKEITTIAKEQVAYYDTVQFHEGFATSGKKTSNGFEITTAKGDNFTAKKLIFATGIKDIMPDIKGFAACWGISVVHCPYCHGYEYRNQNTAIIANGAKAFHLATLVRNLTKQVTVLTNGKAELEATQLEQLKKNHIEVIETKITEVVHQQGQLQSLIFSDAQKISFDVAYASIPFTQHSAIPVALGCELTENGYIKLNEMQQTIVEGVFACGDNTAMMRSVANAVYTGNLTGAIINGLLSTEQF